MASEARSYSKEVPSRTASPPPPRRPATRGLIETVEAIPGGTAVAIALVMMVGIVVANYETTFDLRFSFFYLLPVALVSWRLGRGAGLATAFASAGVWVTQHLWETHGDPARRAPAVANALVLLGFYVLFAVLLSALRQALDREKKAARADPLTGVPNRRAFFEIAVAEIERAARYRGRFTVAFLDLDAFKAVNDRRGHAAGDRALLRVAHAVRGGLRVNDVVARLGGDEFVVLLPETGGVEADAVIGKLRARIAEAQDPGDGIVTVSTGCVTFEQPPGSVDEMLRLVDGVMYEAKAEGGNGLARRVFGQEGATVSPGGGRGKVEGGAAPAKRLPPVV